MRYTAVGAAIKGDIVIAVHSRRVYHRDITAGGRAADLRSRDGLGITADEAGRSRGAGQVDRIPRYQSASGVVKVHIDVGVGRYRCRGAKGFPVEAVIESLRREIFDMDKNAV